MTRPGVDIISRDQAAPRSAPTNTSVWFVVGATAIGPITPTPISSMTQYESIFGTRSGDGIPMYDALDAYFREGGSLAMVQTTNATPSTLSTKKSSKSEDAAPETQAVPTASDVIAALAKLDSKLGPGQVSAPGLTATAIHQAILDHVLATNRVALLEAPPGDATLLAAAAAPLQTHEAAKFAAFFAPQATIPGVASSTTRTIGFASIEAGIIARNDVQYTPNVPSAGTLGISLYALDLSDLFTDTEYETLNESGVDMARNVYGVIEAYGYRTLVDSTVDPLWWNFGHARLHMAIVAQAGAIAERYVFKQLDGRGLMIADFGSELSGMLVPFYDKGALYGATAAEAFSVNVGASVNTPDTIANGELHAVIELKMSPFAEYVVVEIVKVATTEALAA
jgi:hypothetical protein